MICCYSREATQLCVGLGEEGLSGGGEWLEAKDRAFGGYLSSSRWEFKGSIVTSAVLLQASGLTQHPPGYLEEPSCPESVPRGTDDPVRR